MKSYAVWFFSIHETERTPSEIIAWWEVRRLPYNVVIGSIGFVSFLVFFFSIVTSNVLKSGEDAVEPLAIFFAPVAINIFYTAGWVVECFLWRIWPKKRRDVGPALLKMGVGFSLFCVTLPAIGWGSYRLMQLLGLKY